MALDGERVKALESELRRIKNVSYCAVVRDGGGVVQSIDIISDTRRAPNRIVRDAEVILRKHGFDVDHRKISVAQMASSADGRPFLSQGGDGAVAVPAVLQIVGEAERLRLAAVHTSLTGGSLVAEVELIVGAFEGSPGRATGPASDASAAAEVVARATAEAVGNLLAPGYVLCLREARVVEMAGVPGVCALVDFGQGRSVDRLLGSCLRRTSLHEAAVHAVLDALNRRLGRARFRQPALVAGAAEEGEDPLSRTVSA